MSAAYAEPNPDDDTPGTTADVAAGPDSGGAEVVDLSTRAHGHPATDRADTDPDSTVDGDAEVAVPALADVPAPRRSAGWDVAAWAAGERRPIVPSWLRSRAELGLQVRRLVGFALHAAAYHVIRAPKYAARIAVRAPHGAVKSARGVMRWLFDLGGSRYARTRCAGSTPTPT